MQLLINLFTQINKQVNLIYKMLRQINKSRKDYVFQMETITWKQQLFNLFDYDESLKLNLEKQYFQFPIKQYYLYVFLNMKTLKIRHETMKKLQFMTRKQLKQHQQLLFIARTIYRQKKLFLMFYQAEDLFQLSSKNQGQEDEEEGNTSSFLQKQMYLVVRSLKDKQKQQKGYKLQEKQIIKIGRHQYFIHTITNEGNHKKQIDSDQDQQQIKSQIHSQIQFEPKEDYILQNNKKIYNVQQVINGECKYCMTEETQEQGEFLCSPCKCSGSCALVHFNCLVKWNENKVKKNKVQGATLYNFDNFFCQVCKEQYPQFIKKGKKTYEIMPIQKPKTRHMIIEGLNSNKRNIIVIESLPQQGVTFGRGHDSSIKIDDPSISRTHSLIKQIDGQYYIFDSKSKYGTLIRQTNLTMIVKKQQKFSVQVGRTVLTFQLKKKQVKFV